MECISDYSSPIFPVPKPHTDPVQLRAVVDLSELNWRVILDSYQPPSMQQLLEQLHGSTCFSTMDLQHAFLQLALHEQCRPYTAFQWKGKQYCFARVPFGLSSAPLYLQRVLDDATRHLDCTKVYADDSLVHANGEEASIQALKQLFSVFRSLQLKLKPSKCRLGFSKLVWLGRKISAKGIELCDEDLEAIAAWPTPISYHDV